MQTEQFTVQNVKCAGCVNNINSGLLTLNDVDNVETIIDSSIVTVTGSQLSREQISAKLAELGYPEV